MELRIRRAIVELTLEEVAAPTSISVLMRDITRTQKWYEAQIFPLKGTAAAGAP